MTKRFFIKVDKKVAIIDKQENHRIRDMYRACDVLNEQQATIKQLRQSVEYWQKKYEEGTETFQIN